MDETKVQERQTSSLGLESLVGTYHRIGHYGPAYKVMKIQNDERALIALLETGEEVEYGIEDILTDPHPDDEPPPLP